MSKMRLTSAAAVLGILGCAASSDEASNSVVRSTSGDTIVVTNPTPEGVTYSSRLDLRIGELEGADEYTLGGIASIAVQRDGRVAAFDLMAQRISEFDSNGNHLHFVGRTGEGPGEFKQLTGLSYAPDGRLYMRDPSLKRISWFDSTGAFAGSVRVDALSYGQPLRVLNDGTILATVNVARTNGEGWIEHYAHIHRDGAVDTLPTPFTDFELETLEITQQQGNSRTLLRFGLPYLSNRFLGIDPEGKSTSALGSEYVVHISSLMDAAPEQITRIAVRGSPLPVTPDEREALRSSMEANLQNVQPGFRWDGDEIPEFKPHIKRVMTAMDNRIWVQVSTEGTRETDEAGETRWADRNVYDVFSPDGVRLMRVEFPRTFRPADASGDTVWGSYRDELGVSYIDRRIVEMTAE